MKLHFHTKNVGQGRQAHIQCDQMSWIFVQYLAIYSKEICPKASPFYQSGWNIFPNTKWSPLNCQGFYYFAKVVEFCQIWSHCSHCLTLIVLGWSRFSLLKLSHEKNKLVCQRNADATALGLRLVQTCVKRSKIDNSLSGHIFCVLNWPTQLRLMCERAFRDSKNHTYDGCNLGTFTFKRLGDASDNGF